MTTLKEAMAANRLAKQKGGFSEIEKRQQDFAPNGEVSQKITLRCHEDEDVTLYNMFFPKDGVNTLSGEIADRILEDFPEYFEVVAVNGLEVVVPNEIETIDGKSRYKLKIVKGKPVVFTTKVTKEPVKEVPQEGTNGTEVKPKK